MSGADGVQGAAVTRLRTRAERDLDGLVDALSQSVALEPSGIYFGVWCPTCRQDAIPMPNGRCGWCDRRLKRAA